MLNTEPNKRKGRVSMNLFFSAVMVAIMVYGVVRWVRYAKQSESTIDTIISFPEGSLPDLANYPELLAVGQWHVFGNGYRGNCKVNDEQLRQLICETMQLHPDEFTVYNPGSMYLASRVI